METNANIQLKVEITVNASIEKVWEFWTEPVHIVKWNNASADWHTTLAKNDLKVGGKFLSRMEAIDGSEGFDFSGVYTEVIKHKKLASDLDDGRKVEIIFLEQALDVKMIETFEAEKINSMELQLKGWQAILDNFKKYSEQSINNSRE